MYCIGLWQFITNPLKFHLSTIFIQLTCYTGQLMLCTILYYGGERMTCPEGERMTCPEGERMTCPVTGDHYCELYNKLLTIWNGRHFLPHPVTLSEVIQWDDHMIIMWVTGGRVGRYKQITWATQHALPYIVMAMTTRPYPELVGHWPFSDQFQGFGQANPIC